MPAALIGHKTVPLFLVIILCAVFGNEARATIDAGIPDTYVALTDERMKTTYLEVLAAQGESSTGNLFVFQMITPATSETQPEDEVLLTVVQDRGQPRGDEFPTFVFRNSKSPAPELIFRMNAGTRLYVRQSDEDPVGCLISAQKGYSDVCLADANGNAAPDLPGLRKDFWSDLIRLFGL